MSDKTILILMVIIFLLSPVSARAANSLTANSQLDSWQKIDALQRYPLFTPDATPDWQALSQDRDPIVRAATALTIGRLADAQLLPYLLPLFEDESLLTRKCAFWAALHIRSSLVKEPLLKAISSWQTIDQNLPYTSYLLGQIGIGDASGGLLLRHGIMKRSAKEIKFNTENIHDLLTPYNGETRTTISLRQSSFDGDETITVRVMVARLTGDTEATINLSADKPNFYTIAPDGEAVFSDEIYNKFLATDAHAMTDDIITLKPSQTAQREFIISPKRVLFPPGIYLLQSFGATCPVIVQIRESKRLTAALPEMLKDLTDDEKLKLLGRFKVSSAVPHLLEILQKDGIIEEHRITDVGLVAADALADIGGPELAKQVVPILLIHNYWRHGCVVNDTSAIIKKFGPAAYPIFEREILNWRKNFVENNFSLSISLQLLGRHGSPATRQACLEIIETMLQRMESGESKDYREESILSEAVKSIVPTSPNKLSELLWQSRKKPKLFLAILNNWLNNEPFYQVSLSDFITQLWRRVNREPSIDPEIRKRLIELLKYLDPAALTDTVSNLTNDDEALQLLINAINIHPTDQSEQDLRLNTANKVAAYLSVTKSPMVRIYLAELYFEMNEYDKCEPLLDQAIEKLEDKYQLCQAYYYRGEIMLKRGDLDTAQKALRMALEIREKHFSYMGMDKIKNSLAEIEKLRTQ